MIKGVQFLRDVTRTCQLGEIIDQVLAKSTSGRVGKIMTYDVKPNSAMHRKFPALFEGVENPRLRYGYDNPEDTNSFFVNVMSGDSVRKSLTYKKANGAYNATIRGNREYLNCVYNPSRPLFNLSESAIRMNSGANGVADDMLGVMVNMNNSALRAEGVVARERLGSTINRVLPRQSGFSLSSGVEGTPQGRIDLGLDYHGSGVNLRMKDAHLRKVGDKIKALGAPKEAANTPEVNEIT